MKLEPKDTTTTVHMIFGPQGAGKSTYARNLEMTEKATRFSIDEWMADLFGSDLPQPLDFGWIMERVKRCEQRIWSTAKDVAQNGGNIVLDLGFMKVKNRSEFARLADEAGLATRIHFVTALHELRRQRVMARNLERGATFSFSVTPAMFNFMEKQFEPPTALELSIAKVIQSP